MVMVLPRGFEPRSHGLRVRCSAVELGEHLVGKTRIELVTQGFSVPRSTD